MAKERMGRLMVFTITNVAAQFLGSSTDRKRLRFITPSTGTAWWSTESSVVVGGGIQASTSMMDLTEEEHGDIVHQAWFCIASAASATATVLEVMEVEGQY